MFGLSSFFSFICFALRAYLIVSQYLWRFQTNERDMLTHWIKCNKITSKQHGDGKDQPTSLPTWNRIPLPLANNLWGYFHPLCYCCTTRHFSTLYAQKGKYKMPSSMSSNINFLRCEISQAKKVLWKCPRRKKRTKSKWRLKTGLNVLNQYCLCIAAQIAELLRAAQSQ